MRPHLPTRRVRFTTIPDPVPLIRPHVDVPMIPELWLPPEGDHKGRAQLDTYWHRRDFSEKFWAQVDVRGPDECWEWRGKRSRQGYGSCYCPLVTFRGSKGSHRISLFLINGDPRELFVCHHCDNPPCCNPNHLFEGTSTDNMRDMVRKGRSGSAKVTPDQVRTIRERLSHGIPTGELADAFGVTSDIISKIKAGTTWSAVE